MYKEEEADDIYHRSVLYINAGYGLIDLVEVVCEHNGKRTELVSSGLVGQSGPAFKGAAKESINGPLQFELVVTFGNFTFSTSYYTGGQCTKNERVYRISNCLQYSNLHTIPAYLNHICPLNSKGAACLHQSQSYIG